MIKRSSATDSHSQWLKARPMGGDFLPGTNRCIHSTGYFGLRRFVCVVFCSLTTNVLEWYGRRRSNCSGVAGPSRLRR